MLGHRLYSIRTVRMSQTSRIAIRNIMYWLALYVGHSESAVQFAWRTKLTAIWKTRIEKDTNLYAISHCNKKMRWEMADSCDFYTRMAIFRIVDDPWQYVMYGWYWMVRNVARMIGNGFVSIAIRPIRLVLGLCVYFDRSVRIAIDIV